MKKLLFVIAITLIATTASAQSAFEGFYGQIASGYESNQVSNLNATGTYAGTDYSGLPADVLGASNQTFGSSPLIIGIGYNFSVASSWLLGLGVDYSALSQKSSIFSQPVTSGIIGIGATFSGNQLTVSNRFNIFLAPGYAIDKDKLVYLKAGYSSVSLKEGMPTSVSAEGSASLPFTSQTQTLSGYIVGLGYKQMIADGFYGFAEANYMAYGQKTFSSSFNSGPDSYTYANSPNLSSYQALVGIGYKF